MAEAILNQPDFQDADKAREYLEALRWPHGPVCPHCGSVSGKHLTLKGKQYRPGLFKCSDCYEQFTVTVGTVFERSKIKLNVWLQAVHLMCASKKGISAKQLERMLGVTYKTAWFMAHRIREAMTPGYFDGPMGGNGGAVEVDETYYGTKTDAEDKPVAKRRGGAHKMAIVSLVDRQTGEKRSFHMPLVNSHTLKAVINSQVSRDTHLMTDESRLYTVTGRGLSPALQRQPLQGRIRAR
jgi:transposase-like protein